MPVSNPIPFYHEKTPVPLPTPGNLHDHSYTVSPGTTKRKLERALGIEKIKKRKAQMDNIKKSIKIQSLKVSKLCKSRGMVCKGMINNYLKSLN